MGTDLVDRPAPEDIQEVLDPTSTRFEMSQQEAPVHHVQLGGSGSSGMRLLREVARQRGIDVSPELSALRANMGNPTRRQQILDRIMSKLFAQGSW
jgi:hypothetical protein